MSYTKTIRKTVRIPYSGSVSYGPSQSGGSVSYSGTVTEEIEVNVEVDTEPFEESIYNCNQSIGGLTGAVVATEAAQIASINANAKKVSGAIVKGFFSTIRSEITQQIAELKSQVDATLIHLRGLAQRCVEKQKQMERDYNSIAKRYLKTFEDLNNELSNRIYELNKPAFVFSKQSNQQNNRAYENDLVSTVAVFGKEGAELEAKISASIVKKRALDTIEKANTFLLKQKQLEELINRNMLKESKNATAYAPICFIEMENEQITRDSIRLVEEIKKLTRDSIKLAEDIKKIEEEGKKIDADSKRIAKNRKKARAEMEALWASVDAEVFKSSKEVQDALNEYFQWAKEN